MPNINSAKAAEMASELQRASRMGNLELVNELIKQGVDVNARQGLSDNNALRIACEFCQVEVAKILIEHKADPNIHIEDGVNRATMSPPLHMAAQKGPLEMVRLLVDAGADPTVKVEGRKAKTIATEDAWADVIRDCEVRWLAMKAEQEAKAANAP
uniref:Ankyrin repeat domain-containing protein n=1 Tax=Haptolina brevifila TaxID=156173 RepID=A0A7S2N2T5_9EUKA